MLILLKTEPIKDFSSPLTSVALFSLGVPIKSLLSEGDLEQSTRHSCCFPNKVIYCSIMRNIP